MSDTPPILLQLVITFALFWVFLFLSLRYRKPYLKWLTAVWLIYVIRLGAILAFVDTTDRVWLWLHQCATGWTALMLLAASWSFSHRRAGPWVFGTLLVSVPIWSAVAIFVLDEFLLAAGGSALLLSLAAAATAWAFYRFHRDTGSRAALGLAITLTLWALHHLDYPLLRARGSWNPWGYYIDIVFELALGVGVLLLVLEDIERGLRTLGALTLGSNAESADPVTALLERLLTLPGVRGGALVQTGTPLTSRAVGSIAPIVEPDVLAALADLGKQAIALGRPIVSYASGAPTAIPFAYVAALPLRGTPVTSDSEPDVLVVMGDTREPFAALDEQYLRDLGHHVGAAVMKQSLLTELSTRTRELADLSARMVRQHEEERRRLARELHDETAQVFSAVRLQVALLAESSSDATRDLLPRSIAMIDEGIASIRAVTERLRPPLLDDLGLEAALDALARDFADRHGLRVAVEREGDVGATTLTADAELAVFRAVQEGLSNVSLHADATHITIAVASRGDTFAVTIIDDGVGVADSVPTSRMGLVGMRERLHSVGGNVSLRNCPDGGAELEILVPVSSGREAS